MKNAFLAIVLFTLVGCEGIDPVTPLEVPPTTQANEPDCTSWGRISTCPDGSIGCDAMVCLSHDPQPCLPGPNPCNLGK